MATSRSPRTSRGHIYHHDIASPLTYLTPLPTSNAGMSKHPPASQIGNIPHNDVVRAAGRPSRAGSSMLSIEDMHKCYVSNKAELTKHISTAAGAVEQLFGDDGWFVRWYEMPVQRAGSVSSRNIKTTVQKSGPPGTIDLIKMRNDISCHDMHNLVEHVDIPTNMTSWAVKRIVSRFDEQQRLFSWVIGPQEQPLLETMLRGAQLWCEELAPTLSVDLHYRDDLFSEMKHPAPSSAMPPARIEDSDTLPVPERFSWDLQSDRSTPRSEVLRNADTLWSNRRQAHVQRLKGVPESTFHHFQPSNYSQAAMGPLFQTGGDRNQPEQVSEAMPDKDGAGVLDFETAVGVFEKLNVNDADPNRVERLRTLPDGTKLYLLVDRTEVEEWVRTWAYEAEPGSANVEHWTNIYSKLIELLPPNQFKMFAARNSTSGSSGQKQDHRAGEMIGVGYVHLYSGVASIHCITVLPQHRTKGLGSALTRYAMGIGKDMGLHMAMLTASTSSPSYGGKAALFSQLGFKEFGRVKMYVYRPLRLPDTAMLASDKIREAENEGWEWVDDDEDEDSD